MAVNPADSAVFGTLYGSDAMRGIFDEKTLFQKMLDTEAALARVQAQLKIIPEDAAKQITEAAKVENLDMAELARSVQNVGYPVVGVVKGLSRAAGEEAGKWTHWGATTQDIIDTAISLQIREGISLLRADLLATIKALADQAQRHRGSVMAGRTHLQHALPVTFGLKCAVWLQPLVAHVERLDQLRPRVERVQFGGAAGTLASLGADGIKVLDGLASELGLATPPLPWHVSRDGVAETASLLGLMCGSLSKIAFDIILLAQTEVGEVSEPYVAGRGGSSTMPQKRNPIASEYVIAAGRAVQALVPMMQGAMVLDQERGTGPWQAEPLGLPQMFVLTHGALLHTRAIAEGMVVDTARMRRNLDATGGLIMAEAVMMGLAPRLGRDAAHHAVKHACDAALSQGIGLTAALKNEVAVSEEMNGDEIEKLTDPASYLGVTDAFIDRALADVAGLNIKV
jgi:3-carboxy-cis,cis-muconate cycloisomerase